jgi:hypothetical protein
MRPTIGGAEEPGKLSYSQVHWTLRGRERTIGWRGISTCHGREAGPSRLLSLSCRVIVGFAFWLIFASFTAPCIRCIPGDEVSILAVSLMAPDGISVALCSPQSLSPSRRRFPHIRYRCLCPHPSPEHVAASGRDFNSSKGFATCSLRNGRVTVRMVASGHRFVCSVALFCDEGIVAPVVVKQRRSLRDTALEGRTLGTNTLY